MEVELPPEIQAQLQLAAAHSGKTPEEFVQDSISNTLQRRVEFLNSVQAGISAADRGEFVDHEEATRQIDHLLKSQ